MSETARTHAMTGDEHRCGAGKRCRARTVVDSESHPAVIAEPTGLCDRCTEAVRRAISDMRETWGALHASIGDQSRRGGGQRVMGSRSAPININTDVDALKSALVEWLVAAAAPISELMGVDDPRPRNQSDAEQSRVTLACTRILSARIDDLIALPAGPVLVWQGGRETERPGEFYLDEHGVTQGRDVTLMTGCDIALKLVELRGRARSLLALTTPNDRMPVPCPYCNQLELVRSRHTINLVSGETEEVYEIDCGSCGLNWPYERYEHLCEILAKEDEVEREKLQKQLDAEKERRELAEWLLAKREWQFSLALACTDVSASVFAATVLTAEMPDLDEYMSDKDIAAMLAVADSTVRVWASRGAITRHVADDGSTVFLAREVWEYARGRRSANEPASVAK